VEPESHLSTLSAAAEALLRSADGAMDASVPSCPDWNVADLVTHVGLVWGWAADIVTTKDGATFGAPPEGPSEEQLLSWAWAQQGRLLDALGAADPDAECWTFGEPRTARFWFRRQALETVLHAWDAESALGTPSRIDPEVAADGVDEHLTVMVPRSLRRSPDGWGGESVHLHRTDGDGEWVVRLGPEGAVATERAHSKADVALRGDAEALWLWCANRGTADGLGIENFGDVQILAKWATEMVF
jgi:uncharacterized protein (TIGR03083 family)